MLPKKVLGEFLLIRLHHVPAEAAELEGPSLIRLGQGHVAVDDLELHGVHCALINQF